MNSKARICCGLIMTGGLALSLPAATPVIGAQLFQETDARIDGLFQQRNNPPKPPGPLDNPFRTSDAPLANNINLTRETAPAPTPDNSDEAVLRQAAGGLVFGGILQIGVVQVLVINKASYKEGGVIGVRVQGNVVYLRLLNITPNSVTLGLNEARLTLRF